MTNVKRITLITVCLAAILPGNGLWAQQTEATGTTQTADSVSMPAQWDLQSCIDYALQQNISIRRNRINAQSTQVDVKTAKAALFPSLSFSSSQNLVNRPYQESSSIISGSEVLKSSNKTTYNGNYGLNAQWTVYNGSKRLKTIEQEKLNNRVADLDVATSENDIEQSIAQVYIQILYAAESVKVNENTLQVSEAQRDRGLTAGIGTNHTSGSDFTFGEQVKNGWNNSIGLSISVPIFNNRQTKSAVEKAKLQYQTSQLTLLDEQKTLYKTIEGLWLDANSAQQRYAAAIEKLHSTQTSYELVSEQFNAGMKNTVELLTEKNNLLQAQQELLQSKYMAILNTQLLKFYQGDKITL